MTCDLAHWIFLPNVLMAVTTIVVCFPGFLEPAKDWEDWVGYGVMIFVMSFFWRLYLAIAPFAFLLMWLLGDLEIAHWSDSWPWYYVAVWMRKRTR